MGFGIETSVGGGNAAPESILPQGRLFSPSAYIQTSGASEQQLNAVANLLQWSFAAEADWLLESLAVHFPTVTAGGNVTLTFISYTPVYGVAGTVTASVTATGWKTFTLSSPIQLRMGQFYTITLSVAASVDLKVGYHAPIQNTPASNLPAMMNAAFSATGSFPFTSLTQSGQDAGVNYVLDPTAHLCPQVVYGRFNGKYIPVRNAGHTGWELAEIPEAGLKCSCEALTDETGYYVAVRLVDGDPELYVFAPSAFTYVDGFRIGDDEVLVGEVYAIERQTGYQGPVNVRDYLGISNYFNDAVVAPLTCIYGANSARQFASSLEVVGKLAYLGTVETPATGTISPYDLRNGLLTNYGQTVANVQTLTEVQDAGIGFLAVAVEVGVGAWSIKPYSGQQMMLDGVLLDENHKVTLATPALGDCARFITVRTAADTFIIVVDTVRGTWTDGAE